MKVGQLELFELHQTESVWLGAPEDTNLFYIWQQLEKKANSVEDNNPLEVAIIDDTQNINVEDNSYGFDIDELAGGLTYNN